MLKDSVTVSPEFESMATYRDVPATAVFRPSGLKKSTQQEESRDFYLTMCSLNKARAKDAS